MVWRILLFILRRPFILYDNTSCIISLRNNTVTLPEILMPVETSD